MHLNSWMKTLAVVPFLATTGPACSDGKSEDVVTIAPPVAPPVEPKDLPPSLGFPCGDLEARFTNTTWACATDGVFAQHCFASPPPTNRNCCQGPTPPPPPKCVPNPNACRNADRCNGNRKCGLVPDGCGGTVQCGGCDAPGYAC